MDDNFSESESGEISLDVIREEVARLKKYLDKRQEKAPAAFKVKIQTRNRVKHQSDESSSEISDVLRHKTPKEGVFNNSHDYVFVTSDDTSPLSEHIDCDSSGSSEIVSETTWLRRNRYQPTVTRSTHTTTNNSTSSTLSLESTKNKNRSRLPIAISASSGTHVKSRKGTSSSNREKTYLEIHAQVPKRREYELLTKINELTAKVYRFQSDFNSMSEYHEQQKRELGEKDEKIVQQSLILRKLNTRLSNTQLLCNSYKDRLRALQESDENNEVSQETIKNLSCQEFKTVLQQNKDYLLSMRSEIIQLKELNAHNAGHLAKISVERDYWKSTVDDLKARLNCEDTSRYSTNCENKNGWTAV